MPYISVLGSVGSGKTLFLVLMGLLSDKEVVANFELKYPNKKSELLSIDSFVNAKYENKTILLDEIYVYLESRLSHNELHLLMSYILFQSRKLNVTIYGSAQLLSSIDKRFRTEVMNECYVLCEGIYDGFDSNLKKQLKAVKYKFFSSLGKLIKSLVFSIEQISFLFDYYNTNEIIRLEKNNNQFMSGLDRKGKISLYAKQIIEKYIDSKKVTINRVKLFCNENDIDSTMSNDIYTTIKDMNENIVDKAIENVKKVKKSKKSKSK